MERLMSKLLKNNRFYVLVTSSLLAIGIYIYVSSVFQSSQLQIIRLTQMYALTAITYLYVALIVGPLSRFINGPFIQSWLHARRGIGVSAFLFGLLHANLAFFGQLGGFSGLFFLSTYYLVGISFSFIALVILGVMASTSFDRMVAKLKFKKWKRIHQFVYLAGIFILIHALLLGTHFHDLSEIIPFMLFIAVTGLLLLHALCWEKRLQKKSVVFSKVHLLSILVLIVMGGFYYQYMNPLIAEEDKPSLSVHNTHSTTGMNIHNNMQGKYMPGMEGDPKKSAKVEFLYDGDPEAGKTLHLTFKMTDYLNGEPLYYFQTPFEKPFHLIVVNADLSYFSHIHPIQQKNNFVIDTMFPKNGEYHLYADFQPFGMREQQSSYLMKVGNGENQHTNDAVVYEQQKQVGNYIVKLDYDAPLESRKIEVGDQELRFSIYDKNNQPVKTLHTYLGAFGHLVMIKKDTYEYVHAHPVMTRPVMTNELSGPNVPFVPMPISGHILPGVYKLFGQFNPNGELITAGFWIEVK